MPSLSSAVAIVIRDSAGRALLVRDGPERWRLPGGAVREGEVPSETALREAAEELGAQIELDHLIAFYELRGRLAGLRYVYAAHLAAEEQASVPDDGGIFELDYFSEDDLPAQTTTVAPWGVRDAAAGHAGLLRTIEN